MIAKEHTFTNGQISSIDDPLHEYYERLGGSFDKMLEEAGYILNSSYGCDTAVGDMFTMEVYMRHVSAHDKTLPTYLVLMNVAQSIQCVYVDDVIDLIDLLNKYAPLVTASLLSYLEQCCKIVDNSEAIEKILKRKSR